MRLVVTTFAVVGLLVGVLAAYFFTTSAERYKAEATLAMVPAADVPPESALQFWEVLNRGQATRSAAVALGDARWLEIAATAAGVDPSDLTLSAGAITDTTLISVTMEASSAWVAETALDAVLKNGVGYAATISGPFRLETITADSSSATSLSPNKLQSLVPFGVAGLLVGAGVGFLIGRSAQKASARRDDQPTSAQLPEQIIGGADEPTRERNGRPLIAKRVWR